MLSRQWNFLCSLINRWLSAVADSGGGRDSWLIGSRDCYNVAGSVCAARSSREEMTDDGRDKIHRVMPRSELKRSLVWTRSVIIAVRLILAPPLLIAGSAQHTEREMHCAHWTRLDRADHSIMLQQFLCHSLSRFWENAPSPLSIRLLGLRTVKTWVILPSVIQKISDREQIEDLQIY